MIQRPSSPGIRTVFLLLGAMTLLLSACGDNGPETDPAKVKSSPFANPHAGKALARQCAHCHGSDGQSSIIGVPHLAGQNATYLRDALLAYKAGERQHHTMQEIATGLTAKQMLDLAAWYSDLPIPKKSTPLEQKFVAKTETSDEATGIREGRRLARNCADCHGPLGNSSVAGIPNLTGQHPDYLTTAINHCRTRKDPELRKLNTISSDTDLADIALFYAVQKPEISSTAALGNPDSAMDRAKKCTFCHGKNGNSKKAHVPSLAGQDPAYLSSAMLAYASGERDHAAMSKAVGSLGEGEISDLAAWFARQQPEIAPRIRVPRSARQWSQKCDSCHGKNGNGLGNAAPAIAGQRREYLYSSMLAYKENTREDGNMHGMSRQITLRELDELARYYSEL